jgi:hypothetical protein
MQASASQTLQALVDCAEHLTDGSAHGRVQALQGLLDIHKAAVSGSSGVHLGYSRRQRFMQGRQAGSEQF